MIENESNTPYVAAVAMTLGLLILVYGVEIGTHDSPLSFPLQGLGGAIIVIGCLGLAYYIQQLPGGEDAH